MSPGWLIFGVVLASAITTYQTLDAILLILQEQNRLLRKERP